MISTGEIRIDRQPDGRYIVAEHAESGELIRCKLVGSIEEAAEWLDGGQNEICGTT
jgi:hypothetical protein